jgi:hypothetical protein
LRTSNASKVPSNVTYPDTRHAWVYQRSTTAARRETKSIHSELVQGIEIALDDIL